MSAKESEYTPSNLPKAELFGVSQKPKIKQLSIIESKKEPSSKARLLASYSSTILGVTVTSPIEVLKTRLQVQHDKEHIHQKYTGIFHSFNKIWKQEGFWGMFRGYRASVVTTPVFHSIYFPIYERLRLHFSEKFGLEKSSLKVVFMSCGIAGTFSSILTNPMWMIRTRMQAEIFKSKGKPNYQNNYNTIFGSILRVYRNEGFLALYTGLTASLLNISHVLVYFPIYENSKVILKNYFEPERESLSSPFISLSVLFSKLCASLVSYPAELIRARQQDTRRSDVRGNNFSQVLNRTYARQGILGFYSGFSLNLLRILPQNIIVFLFYEKLSETLSEKFDI